MRVGTTPLIIHAPESIPIISNMIIDTDVLVLAIGHSARDTFKMLYENKLKELCSLKTQKVIDSRTFTLRDIYMRATFYHVYYL